MWWCGGGEEGAGEEAGGEETAEERPRGSATRGRKKRRRSGALGEEIRVRARPGLAVLCNGKLRVNNYELQG